MVSLSKDWVIIIGVSYLTYLVFYRNLDAAEIFRRGTYILLGLGFLSLFIHLVQQSFGKISQIWTSRLERRANAEETSDDVNEEVLRRIDAQKQESRKKTQQHYTEQVRDHTLNVVQPKQREKQKKKEEDFYKFMGPAWKGSANKLGHTEGTETPTRSGTGIQPAREASELRHLPDEDTNSPLPQPVPKSRRKIELPEEPVEGTEGSVNLLFRTPISRVLRRRFLTTDSVQLVLDYITTCGFSRRIYTISTSYPRLSLSQYHECSLQELGINTDTVLNIEEKE